MRKSSRKLNTRSAASVGSTKSTAKMREDIYIPPLDILTVKILGLQLSDDDPRFYAIKVTFFDQLILSSIIKPVINQSRCACGTEEIKYKTLAIGTLNYDPSDYEKMCLFADTPLIVNIQPLKDFEMGSLYDGQENTPISDEQGNVRPESETKYHNTGPKPVTEISCCNIDILPLFIELDTMCVKKRLQPMIPLSVLCRKSWDNLPLVTMKIQVERAEDNTKHHEVLNKSNFMKITLVGAYNMCIPFDSSLNYVAATKSMVSKEMNTDLVTFSHGHVPSSGFNSTSFYPKWESLRVGEEVFSNGDDKYVCEIQNLDETAGINVAHFLNESPAENKTIWGSFHRTLILGNSEKWLVNHIRPWKWPLELHLVSEQGVVYSFMGFLDLFKLLYPGENRVNLAVPLEWWNVQLLKEKCNCDALMNFTPSTQKPNKVATLQTSGSQDSFPRTTGGENTNAFIIIEVILSRPLVKQAIPPVIPPQELDEMLAELETHGRLKRECTGRGQLVRDWHHTVRAAANSLRRVPHYGMTEFCLFNRQLSETRTRVELTTSFWMDSAIFVNNNFVVQEFLKSEKTYEEMLMMTHACLMKATYNTLIGIENWKDLDPMLKAARHARQLQNIPHATELYLLHLSEKRYDEHSWRELATCLREVNRDWAIVCIDKSLKLDIRHPLTLLSKACLIFEEDREGAELFFTAILTFYPLWSTGLVIGYAYFNAIGLFKVADQIMECLKHIRETHQVKDFHFPRSWEHELGDWWENTPLLTGTSQFYDGADLLLRLRAIEMAEVCVANSLLEGGETAAYFHLIALCCRLQGKVDEALCHLKRGIEKFGDLFILRSLEGECYHKKNDVTAAAASFDKVGGTTTAFTTLLSLPSRDPLRTRPILVDLVRRQPSACAWLALAEDWLQRADIGEGDDGRKSEDQASALNCAVAYAVQALKDDRRSARAWTLLSKLVKPSARRLYCRNMAASCGSPILDDKDESDSISRQSVCHHLGIALLPCNCCMCNHLSI